MDRIKLADKPAKRRVIAPTIRRIANPPGDHASRMPQDREIMETIDWDISELS